MVSCCVFVGTWLSLAPAENCRFIRIYPNVFAYNKKGFDSVRARRLYHFKPETCVKFPNPSFPRVHLCMENTLWFLAIITGSGATL